MGGSDEADYSRHLCTLTGSPDCGVTPGRAGLPSYCKRMTGPLIAFATESLLITQAVPICESEFLRERNLPWIELSWTLTPMQASTSKRGGSSREARLLGSGTQTLWQNGSQKIWKRKAEGLTLPFLRNWGSHRKGTVFFHSRQFYVGQMHNHWGLLDSSLTPFFYHLLAV